MLGTKATESIVAEPDKIPKMYRQQMPMSYAATGRKDLRISVNPP